MGAMIALLSVSALALFTDTDSVGTNSFDTGSISLTTAPTATIWTAVTSALPGDKATGALTVTNAGSVSLRYAVTGANTDATLSAAMNLRIGLQVGGSCDFPYHNDDGTNVAFTDDTAVYSGLMSTTALVGLPAAGNDAGDRTLASGSEVLCFAVVLPDTATNTVNGLSNTTTFTFDSEQTANNP
jgi:predicted ribosomally synthesized peptide with SipW-like signal peptide